MAGGQRFEAADMNKANQDCGPRPGQQIFEQCPACDLRVGLHCGGCRVQVTGCLCTEQDRFGKEEAYQRAVQRFGDRAARERMKAAGFWVPEMHD